MSLWLADQQEERNNLTKMSNFITCCVIWYTWIKYQIRTAMKGKTCKDFRVAIALLIIVPKSFIKIILQIAYKTGKLQFTLWLCTAVTTK